MTQTIKNFMTVGSEELQPGDVLVCTVVLHINHSGFRMYRCPYPPPTYEGIPQGSRISGEETVAGTLFPVVNWAGLKPDTL